MARGINKTISIGNVCADPEVRHMPNGGAVTNISLVMNNSYNDKKTGQKVEQAEFIKVVFFNRLGEIAGEFLKKGSKVYIEGSLRTRQWEKDGVKRYTTEIVAAQMQMLDSRASAGGGENTSSGAPAASTGSQGAQSVGDMSSQLGSMDDLDDDIPF